MVTDNVRLAAYLVTVGFPVTSIDLNERGFGLFAFGPDAQAHEVDFWNNAPVPCRTYLDAYKKLLRRVNDVRVARKVGGPSRG